MAGTAEEGIRLLRLASEEAGLEIGGCVDGGSGLSERGEGRPRIVTFAARIGPDGATEGERRSAATTRFGGSVNDAIGGRSHPGSDRSGDEPEDSGKEAARPHGAAPRFQKGSLR